MQHADPRRAPRGREPRPGRQVGAGARGEGPLILGAVLAGGRSSRFGADKAAATLDGRALLDHAAAAIAPWVGEVVVIGGPARDGMLVLPDRPAPDLGPLGGIAGAVSTAAERGGAGALTIACDTPRLPDGLVEHLVRRGPSYCVEAPVIGYWPVTLLDGLLAYLKRRGFSGGKDASLSLRKWADTIGALPISAGGPIGNVNTPEDLARLREPATA